MADDWQPGDMALCVNAGSNPIWGEANLVRGACYTVQSVHSPLPNVIFGYGMGLQLHDVRCICPFGYAAARFRKIRPHTPDAEDRETIALLTGKPVREPVA